MWDSYSHHKNTLNQEMQAVILCVFQLVVLMGFGSSTGRLMADPLRQRSLEH